MQAREIAAHPTQHAPRYRCQLLCSMSAPRERERPASIINLSDRPVQKRARSIWCLESESIAIQSPGEGRSLEPGGQPQINHPADRSQGSSHAGRVTAAQPLRYCRITARHQKSRTLQSKQRRKKEKKWTTGRVRSFLLLTISNYFFKNIYL